MGKKRKNQSASVRPPQSSVPASPTPPQSSATSFLSLVTEILRHPMLALGWFTLTLMMFSIGAAIWFRNDMEMGAIREPTGTIMLAGISLTAFASYKRQVRREEKSRADRQ